MINSQYLKANEKTDIYSGASMLLGPIEREKNLTAIPAQVVNSSLF